MQRSRSELRRKMRREKRRRILMRFTFAVAALVLITVALLWNHLNSPYQPANHPGTIAQATPSPSPDQANTPDPGRDQGEAPTTAEPEESPAPGSEPAASPTPGVIPNMPDAKPDGGKGTVRMAFVGDVLLGSTVDRIMQQNGYDYPYRKVKSYLTDADITIANLETPITDRGEPEEKDFVYRSSPNVLPDFKDSGIDVVTLANNHILDYGAEGLFDTMEYLEQWGIQYTGAGRNVEEAYRPAVVEANGIKVAFLGLSRKVPDGSWKAGPDHPGTTQLYDERDALKIIAQTKEEADLVVVYAHWGEERVDSPDEHQLRLAKKFIDAGADLVVGSHPHVLQGLEQYKGKWIAYSLGNFIFTTRPDAPLTWETIILEAECTADGVCDLSAIPINNYGAQPVPMDEEAGRKLFERLTEISFGVEVKPDGTIQAK